MTLVEAHKAQPLDDSGLPQWRMLELDRLHWGGLCLSRHSILLAILCAIIANVVRLKNLEVFFAQLCCVLVLSIPSNTTYTQHSE